jgi:single-stranded DNA-binding protein
LPPWKNTDDEWASKTEWHRVCVFRPRFAEYVATTIKKGSHVLVEEHDVQAPFGAFPL